MASHQTTNFQLCQWEAEDNILRTDFNSDNLKLEAALTAASRSTLLLDWTLDAATELIRLDLTGADLLPFRRVVLYPELLTSEPHSAYLHFNNDDSDERAALVSDSGSGGTASYFAIVDTSPTASNYVDHSTFNRITLDLTCPRVNCEFRYAHSFTRVSINTLDACRTNFSAARFLTWDQITELDFSCEYEMKAGSSVKIWGVT